MKKSLLLGVAFAILTNCGTSSKGSANTTQTNSSEKIDPTEFASTITSAELKTMLYKYASDEFEGRDTGEKGQKLAANYLVAYYKKNGITATNKEGNYLQNIPKEYFRGRSQHDSENVIAYIN